MIVKAQSGQTLDLRGQVLNEVVSLRDCCDMTIIGGTHVGIEAFGCVNTVIRDGTVCGPPDKVGIMFRGGQGCHVHNMDLTDCLNSVVWLETENGSLLDSRLSRYRGDGFHVFGSRRIRIGRNRFFDTLNDGFHHGDAGQFHNTTNPDGSVKCWVSDVWVFGNDVDVYGQGFNNQDDGDLAWMSRIHVEGNRMTIGAYRALGLHHVHDGRCVGNTVSLKAGAVSGTRERAVTSTKVTVGPGVFYEGNTLGVGAELVRVGA